MVKAITDFEETRRCLLNTYHDYVQNHVGYMIAIVISLVGFSTYQNIFKNILLPFLPKNLSNSISIISIIIVVLIYAVAIFHVYRRTKLWTSYANIAIILPENDAIKFFNEYPSEKKHPYSSKSPAPNTAILQIAISQYRWHSANDKMLYVKCKTKNCGKDFATDLKIDKKSFDTSTLVDKECTCPRGHTNKYNKVDYHFKEKIYSKNHN